MGLRKFLTCLGLLCLSPNLILNAEDGKITERERAKLIKLLQESESETLALVERLDDGQWKFKPAPDRWSVAEVVEHVVLAEASLFSKAQEALKAPLNPDWEAKTKGKTEFLERVMPTRTGRAKAPDEIVPEGKVLRADLMRKLRQVRARTMQLAESVQAPLKAHTAEHPFPIFSTLNAYQWLLYIPLHNQRHNKQIEEVLAHPDFPKP
jgi:hypothetical protein